MRWELNKGPVPGLQRPVEEGCLLLLYAGSPFFSLPHKPLVGLALGSPYPRAYRHFRSAHAQPANVALHLLSLCYSLVANAALIHCIEASLAIPPGLIGRLNLVLWAGLLVFRSCGAPVLSRAVAVALMVGAVWIGPLAVEHWRALVWVDVLLQAVCLKYGDAKAVPTAPDPPLWLLTLCRLAGQALVPIAAEPLTGHLAWFNLLACGLVLQSAVRPFYNPLNCYWCGYLGGALAVLTDQPWLLFHGAGFNASLFQGVSHELSQEAANLPELATRTGADRTADEIAHVCFFPVLIVHSAMDSCGCG